MLQIIKTIYPISSLIQSVWSLNSLFSIIQGIKDLHRTRALQKYRNRHYSPRCSSRFGFTFYWIVTRVEWQCNADEHSPMLAPRPRRMSPFVRTVIFHNVEFILHRWRAIVLSAFTLFSLFLLASQATRRLFIYLCFQVISFLSLRKII